MSANQGRSFYESETAAFKNTKEIMVSKPVFTVGRHPHSKPKPACPTTLLQAQALGYIKRMTLSSSPYYSHITVIEIHETDHGFQIELDEE